MSSQPTWHSYVFAGLYGHVVALDKRDGSKVWETSLPKTGYSVVSIVVEDGMLLCGTGGKVFALDPMSGEIRWENNLPGMGRGVVYLTTARGHGTEAIMSMFEEHRRNQAAAASAGS